MWLSVFFKQSNLIQERAQEESTSYGRSTNLVTFLVRDYNEAIDWFTGTLEFSKTQDVTNKETGVRWVVIAPSTNTGTSFLLAQAQDDEEKSRVGTQTGNNVGFFLSTPDFERDYKEFMNKGLTFLEQPRYEVYGTVAVFVDLYGNKWDLIEHNS